MKMIRTIPDIIKAKCLKRIRFRKIPIKQIRCQRLRFSKIQGFYGKPIDYFPPCTFYQMYLENKNEATHHFVNWLYHCLINLNAWKIGREEGGWKDGSLVQEIYNIHRYYGIEINSFENPNHDYVKEGINLRVKKYFKILESIKNNSYNKSVTPPILCYRRNKMFYLIGGHHRVSALYALQKKTAYIRIYRSIDTFGNQ